MAKKLNVGVVVAVLRISLVATQSLQEQRPDMLGGK